MGYYNGDDLQKAIDKGMYDNTVSWGSPTADTYFPSIPEVKWEQLPPGAYSIAVNMQRGLYFARLVKNNDMMVHLPDTVSDSVIKVIDDFWGLKDKFIQSGFLWKRGVLLFGPPGSGKTATINMVTERLISNGGIVLYIDKLDRVSPALQLIRKIEPDRPIIVILEDIDLLIEDEGDSDITALLDGETQVDNVVYIATTNHIDKLDTRLTNRPSRFDEVLYIGMPSAPARRVYIESVAERVNIEGVDLEELVSKTEGFSIAHIKELIISVFLFNKDLDSAVTTLKELLLAEMEYDDDDCTAVNEPYDEDDEDYEDEDYDVYDPTCTAGRKG